jgi:predicted TIM-barrel fold metal-dependent hydrolase
MTGAIVDAHHHIWLRDRTPWLQGPTVPRIFGDYTAIKRDYGIEEFAADSAPHGVTQSVYVQVNVAPGDEVWEAEWAAREGLRHELVQAVTAFCDLSHPNASAVLDRLAANPRVRGIRQQMHWHEQPLYRFQQDPARFLQADWQDGLRAMGQRGLHFELQVFPEQAEAALALIDGHPQTQFVLLHAGMPWDMSPEGRSRWLAALRAFALRDNVVTKLSAFGTFSRACEFDAWTAVIRPAVDIFGPARCIWGSNFPIEKLWTSYSALIGAVRAALAVYTPAEQADILGNNARRFYRLPA